MKKPISETDARKSSHSGTRKRSLPPLGSDEPAVSEEDLFALLTQAEQSPGFTYPPSWAAVVYEAKRKGYVNEAGLKVYLSNHGQQLLTSRAKPNDSATKYTMTKIDKPTRLALKDLSHDTGVPMQEALGHLIQTVHKHRDALTRAARAAGREHPWEGIEVVLKKR